MSTKSNGNLIGKIKTWNQRSLAGKRKAQARRQMNDVTVQLIKQATGLGFPAKYVLFDSWFSSSKMFFHLKQLGLDSLGMSKCSTKIYYVYHHRHYDIKGLYNRLASSKMTKKNGYLYSCIVIANYQGHKLLLRIVFVFKRGSKKYYLALATTQYKLTPQQIIQLYGRRWQIETYFKTAKQFLAWQGRQSSDNKTLGDLFYLMNDSLLDIKFIDALVYLLDQLKMIKGIDESKLANAVDNFMSLLSEFIQIALETKTDSTNIDASKLDTSVIA